MTKFDNNMANSDGSDRRVDIKVTYLCENSAKIIVEKDSHQLFATVPLIIRKGNLLCAVPRL